MIRPATPQDIEALTALMNDVIRNTTITVTSVEKSPQDVAQMIRDRRALGFDVLVAYEDNSFLGYASYAQFRPSPGYSRTMEHSIALTSEARGRGTGRALMAAIETHATRFGAHVMIGAITSDNVASLDFHKRLGYEQVGFLPQVGYKFGRYHDLVLMQKILS